MLAATARHAARRGSATAVPRRCSSLRAQLRRTQPNSADGAAAAAPRYYSTAAQVAAAAAAADCAIPSPDECWSGGQLTSLTPEVLAHAEQTFLKNGMCFFPSALSAEWVANAHDTAVQRWTHNLARLPGGDLEVGMEHGYAEVVHRARGRYDMLDGIDGQAPFADADAVVAPLMQRLLGQDCHRLFNGLLMTRPGSSEQLWHVDGEHLFSTPSGEAEDVSGSAAALPAHCVNVFVPLVDITRSNGATEFCLGSVNATQVSSDIVWQDEKWKDEIPWDCEPSHVDIPAGSILLFDYRLLHRGQAHTGEELRPLLYYTHGRRWFSDTLNFPKVPAPYNDA